MSDSSIFATGEFSLVKFVSAVLGGFVSLRFVQGTLFERITMGIGGATLSYLASTPAAKWLGMEGAEGLVGFLIGLFGMAIIAKIYEVITLLDAKVIASDLWEAIKRKWKA